jgi:predicted Rossmann fold nucleotide-binding protein DprA/Smf involved in DNA uptake
VKQKTKSKNIPDLLTLTPSQALWPRHLGGRLGNGTPCQLWAIGNPDILNERKVGLFCSVRYPAEANLEAQDAARRLRDEGSTVISGFHSPVEKECLRILLQGNQPIIFCLARSLFKIRIPSEWRKALDAGRLFILSPFEKRPRRPDARSARRRNELVAALADEVLIIHATPGGQIERIAELVDHWHIPRRKLI